MNRAEMLAELREVLDETSSAWQTPTLLRYLAEGQDKFCEETGFFTDLTNYFLTLQTGVSVYAIPDRVIQVLDIWNGTTKLEKEDNTSDPVAGNTGMPASWRTDQETGIISLYPTPTAAENNAVLTLRVWRYSRYDLAGNGPIPVGETIAPPAAPEIPSRLQRACIEWAAYKAFMHHDMDTQDPVKAKEHLIAFNGYVLDGRATLRRRHNTEVRVGFDSAYRT